MALRKEQIDNYSIPKELAKLLQLLLCQRIFLLQFSIFYLFFNTFYIFLLEATEIIILNTKSVLFSLPSYSGVNIQLANDANLGNGTITNGKGMSPVA